MLPAVFDFVAGLEGAGRRSAEGPHGPHGPHDGGMFQSALLSLASLQVGALL
jgi:hypothetical protein